MRQYMAYNDGRTGLGPPYEGDPDDGMFLDYYEAIGLGYYDSGAGLVYAFYDLDGNGTNEFFVGQMQPKVVLLNAFGFDGEKAYALLPNYSNGGRWRLHIMGDGSLVDEGSSSAFESFARAHRFNSDGIGMSMTEGYYYCTHTGPCECESFYAGCTRVTDANMARYYELCGDGIEGALDWTGIFDYG